MKILPNCRGPPTTSGTPVTRRGSHPIVAPLAETLLLLRRQLNSSVDASDACRSGSYNQAVYCSPSVLATFRLRTLASLVALVTESDDEMHPSYHG